jgi:hypothetical protein
VLADVGADIERDQAGELGDELVVIIRWLEVAVVGDRPGGAAVRPGEPVGVEVAQEVAGVEAVVLYLAVGRPGEVVERLRRAEVARIVVLGRRELALALGLPAQIVAQRARGRVGLVGAQVCGAPLRLVLRAGLRSLAAVENRLLAGASVRRPPSRRGSRR